MRSSEKSIKKNKTAAELGLTRGDLLRELDRRMRASFRILKSRRPKLIKTTECLLEMFLKRELQISLLHFPREHYISRQVVLEMSRISQVLANSSLTFLDMREGLGNLAYMYESFQRFYPPDAFLLQSYLRQLLCILDEPCLLLEKAALIVETDWYSVKRTFDLMEPASQESNFDRIIPTLNNIIPIKLLGMGGFGAIYKVRCKGIDMVAKLVPTEKLKKPKYACVDKAVASVTRNPLIAKYYVCFATDKAFVTLMEYIRGVDLNRILRVNGALESGQIAIILAQLGLAIQYLHFRGFIHRDVKPANLIICSGFRAKLIDLDTCKICSSLYCDGYTISYRQQTFAEFGDRQTAGTLAFLSPEAVNKQPYGRSTDFWAIGVTTFAMAYGKLPFRGRDETIKSLIRNQDIIYPEGGNRVLKDLIVKLLRKEPWRRITSACFDEFKMHPFFREIDWTTINKSTSSCDTSIISGLMNPSENPEGYSVKTYIEVQQKKKKAKALLCIDDLSDVHEHKPLYTYVSEQFSRSFTDAEKIDTSTSSENYDFLPSFKEKRQRATYKFQNFLKWKTSDQ